MRSSALSLSALSSSACRFSMRLPYGDQVLSADRHGQDRGRGHLPGQFLTSDAQLSAVSADGRILLIDVLDPSGQRIGGDRDRGFDLGVLLGGRLLGLAKPMPYLSCLGRYGLRFTKRFRVSFDQLVGPSRGGCPQPGSLPQGRA